MAKALYRRVLLEPSVVKDCVFLNVLLTDAFLKYI